jgi:DNA polymerase III delta subunit
MTSCLLTCFFCALFPQLQSQDSADITITQANRWVTVVRGRQNFDLTNGWFTRQTNKATLYLRDQCNQNAKANVIEV